MNKINKKILIGIIALLLIVIACLLFRQKTFNNTLQSENDIIGTNIIQARLIYADNPSFDPLPKLYEGTLTFQNLNDFTNHTYFVCLEDWSVVKLNAIYDLPANYYIPRGTPGGSMKTNGCNGLLHLSVKSD